MRSKYVHTSLRLVLTCIDIWEPRAVTQNARLVLATNTNGSTDAGRERKGLQDMHGSRVLRVVLWLNSMTEQCPKGFWVGLITWSRK